ncbi:MAG: ATP-binding protein, partial [Chitinophagaceae bacterium]
LSTIRFLSEKVKRNSFSEVTKNDTDKIVFNSNELMQKMNEIIWAMNEKNDTLEDLLFYARSYAVEYCEENKLRCETHLPETVPPFFISGEVRRNVFLTIKESLHNIIKHAAAKQVSINFSVDKHLMIAIKDDGKGMTKNKVQEGNGLRNMKKRIESVGGTFDVQNKNGVMVEMSIPLPV